MEVASSSLVHPALEKSLFFGVGFFYFILDKSLVINQKKESKTSLELHQLLSLV
jgi:hypothetical protein